MIQPGETYRLAQRIAAKLSGTPAMRNIEDVLEEMEVEPMTAAAETEFLRHLDRLIFICAHCEWWHDQSENATPDGAQWICRECDRNG